MPKIVINEYDLTKAGTSEYENFAVVVPGFLGELGEGGTRDVFDENGIYECNNQDDFVKNVGKRAAEVVTSRLLVEAVAPTIYHTIKYVPENVDEIVPIKNNKDEIIGHEYRDQGAFEAALNSLRQGQFNFNSGGNLHTELQAATVEIKYDPDLIDSEGNPLQKKVTDITDAEGKRTITWYFSNEDEYDKADKALKDKAFDITTGTVVETDSDAYDVYYAVKNISGKPGKLRDANLEYKVFNTESAQVVDHTLFPQVNKGVLNVDRLISATYSAYYVIYDDSIGKNGKYVEDRITHYGNQMAYELLGLGYTVLYKQMSEHNDEALAKIIYATDEDGKYKEIKDADDNVLGYELKEDSEIFADQEVTDLEVEINPDSTGTYVLKPEFSAAICELSDGEFWRCLKDKSTYDFRYIVTGLLTNHDEVNSRIIELADHSEEVLLDDASIDDGRGDCIALIDLDSAAYAGKTQTQAIPALAKEAAKWSSAYAAVFAPYVSYIMPEDKIYQNNVFPASFHYLACAANSANNNFNEWYANAGYTRGVSKYTIQSTGCKFGEIAVQSLEPRFMIPVDKELEKDKDGKIVTPNRMIDINTTVAVNLIIKIKSSYYLWGNRTGKKLGTRYASDGDLVAQHFLNIRQLATTIKKQVYVTCRRLTFDPNSNTLWINFRGLLTPLLEQMKADQGIRDYEFIRDYTDRKALLKARIRIVPIEAVEDFEIGLYLEDSLEDVVLTEA